MPSTKDPNIVVQAGPGRLPAGVVPAGALLFPPGGGSGAALQAHITDPIDAHMASAIGINPFYPPTGAPILSSVGGVVDGENVLDFINEFKDLIPVRPNSIGFNVVSAGTSGIPNWDLLNALGVGTGTAVTGGYKNGANVEFSHYLVPVGTTTFTPSGLVFPSDRGVIALYKNTDGNFFNAGATTLVAALWLGDSPSPAGIPDAAFNELLRSVQQLNYVATNAGIDFFNLTFRLPYLANYAPYPGTPYGPFGQPFFGYQLSVFALPAQSVAAGDAQNFLFVHWKETYATSLAAIQPAGLTLVNLVSSKAYSAVPVAGNFDDNTQAIYNANRHHVFNDTASATAPTGNTFTSLAANAPATVQYSGVTFTNVNTLQFDLTLAANDLFDNSFETGSVVNPPNVPAQFNSLNDPMNIGFGNFGGGTLLVPYNQLRKQGVPPNYSPTNAPLLADIGEYINATLAIFTPATNFTPNNTLGHSALTASFFKPFNSGSASDVSKRYLYNSFPAAGGAAGSATTTLETFVDEHYRYTSTHVPLAADTIVPTVPYVSATSLVVDTNSSQIVTNNLTYPQIDWSAATYFPAVSPNYSGLPGSDGVNHLRRHLRAVNTGIARNTGKLRLRFSIGGQASFTTDAAFDGTEITGHITGGMIVQVMVPGVMGWLDIGCDLGDPGVATLDFYGCSTGVLVSGSDVTVSFQTTAFTANNGFGEYPLFVRVSLLNNVAGLAVWLDEVEWLAP